MDFSPALRAKMVRMLLPYLSPFNLNRLATDPMCKISYQDSDEFFMLSYCPITQMYFIFFLNPLDGVKDGFLVRRDFLEAKYAHYLSSR